MEPVHVQGKLRGSDYPLNKVVKRKHEQSDTMIRVPMLGYVRQ